jgi:hypothetical protein
MEFLATSCQRADLTTARFLRASSWLLTLVFILLPLSAWGESAVSKEYQLKAAFLYNFAKFVEWPQGCFSDPETMIRIGVLGADPFGSALEDITRDATIRNRKLMVQRSQRMTELKGCHLLFVCQSEKARLREILASLGNEPILTVSDIEGFTDAGGMIRFYIADRKVRFEINPTCAAQHGLKISAQLLSLGRIIGSPENKGER